MNKLSRILFLGLLSLVMSGCLYRMPTENDPDIKPRTNNPSVINEAAPGWMPGVSY
jgi:hypothetical protein